MDLFGLGPAELLLILFVLLLFFGKDKLPDLAKSIGRSFRELKSGFTSEMSDTKEAASKDSKKKD
jgi:TatA/E family protein of Tat protein translocase